MPKKYCIICPKQNFCQWLNSILPCQPVSQRVSERDSHGMAPTEQIETSLDQKKSSSLYPSLIGITEHL